MSTWFVFSTGELFLRNDRSTPTRWTLPCITSTRAPFDTERAHFWQLAADLKRIMFASSSAERVEFLTRQSIRIDFVYVLWEATQMTEREQITGKMIRQSDSTSSFLGFQRLYPTMWYRASTSLRQIGYTRYRHTLNGVRIDLSTEELAGTRAKWTLNRPSQVLQCEIRYKWFVIVTPTLFWDNYRNDMYETMDSWIGNGACYLQLSISSFSYALTSSRSLNFKYITRDQITALNYDEVTETKLEVDNEADRWLINKTSPERSFSILGLYQIAKWFSPNNFTLRFEVGLITVVEAFCPSAKSYKTALRFSLPFWNSCGATIWQHSKTSETKANLTSLLWSTEQRERQGWFVDTPPWCGTEVRHALEMSKMNPSVHPKSR
jgi:hypothetical protein